MYLKYKTFCCIHGYGYSDDGSCPYCEEADEAIDVQFEAERKETRAKLEQAVAAIRARSHAD